MKRIEDEVVRMQALNTYLAETGRYAEMTFIDMAEETIDLLKQIITQLSTDPGTAGQVLLQRMNDQAVSNYIVFHFRFLAAAYLRGHAEEYQGFMEDGSIENYCNLHLESTDSEIDHLGITLLFEMVLKPLGFCLVIADLDRYAGAEVNHHEFVANPTLGVTDPVIYLLFRPTHYDILYKDETPVPPPGPATSNTVEVHHVSLPDQQASVGTDLADYSRLDLQGLSDLGIPGMFTLPTSGYAPHSPQDGSASTSSLRTSLSPVPSTASPLSPIFGASSGFAAPVLPIPSLPTPVRTRPNFPAPASRVVPLHPLSNEFAASPVAAVTATMSGVFRPGRQREPVAEPAPSFQTSMFRESHFNTAHYSNPDFQPEEWSPADM